MRFRHEGASGRSRSGGKPGRGLRAREERADEPDDDDDDDDDDDEDEEDDGDEDEDEDGDEDEDEDDADGEDDDADDDDGEEDGRRVAARGRKASRHSPGKPARSARDSQGRPEPRKSPGRSPERSKRKKPESPGGKQLQRAGFRILNELEGPSGKGSKGPGKPKWFEVEGDHGGLLVLRQTPHLWYGFAASKLKAAESADDLFDGKKLSEDLDDAEKKRFLRELLKAPEKVMLGETLGKTSFNQAVVFGLLAQRMERGSKRPGARKRR